MVDEIICTIMGRGNMDLHDIVVSFVASHHLYTSSTNALSFSYLLQFVEEGEQPVKIKVKRKASVLL